MVVLISDRKLRVSAYSGHHHILTTFLPFSHIFTVVFLTEFTSPYSLNNLLSSRLLSKNLKIKIYRTIISPVVLYGCETWSLKLREEMKLGMSENTVVSGIFGPRRDEVTGE